MFLKSIHPNTNTKSYQFAWAIVWYTVVVISWGAWVRISHSGDGCGDHWPLCNGRAIPIDAPIKTWIEISHRYSTALYGILVLSMIATARTCFKPNHPARFWSVVALFFTITEALIGRQLVTMRLVDQSTDLIRLIVMPLHLVNTSALLFSAVMAAESFRYGSYARKPLSPQLCSLFWSALLFMLLVISTGAVASLASHLNPSSSLQSGLAMDLSNDSHLSIRLRFLHPLIALSLVLVAPYLLSRLIALAPSNKARSYYRILRIGIFLAIIIGVLTLISLAPIWLKLTHLLITNLLIILASVGIFHTLTPTDQPS